MSARDFVLQDVERYGITAPPVAARVLGTHVAAARRLLEGLVRAGALVRHEANGTHYFTNGRKPLPAYSLRRAFAFSWYCHMVDPSMERVPIGVVESVVAPVLPHLGVGPLRDVPAALNRKTGRLAMFLVGIDRGGCSELQDDLGHLQRTVRSSWFQPWLYLASAGHAELVYLHPVPAEVSELRRWLALHPLLAELALKAPSPRLGRAVAVAVTVAPLVELRAQKRQKPLSELLSPTSRRTTG